MDDHYLATLEFFKIIEQLAKHTAFSASEALARSLRPAADEAEVRRRLQETTEAKALIAQRGQVGVGGAHDVRPLARRAALAAMLQPSELLAIRSTLLSARSLHYLLIHRREEYPLLAARADEIQPLSELIAEIERCLDEEGNVLDRASPTLARIRQERDIARERLMERLRRMVTSEEYARYLQEPLVTERNRRYVIPLKAEFKGRIPGIIHDQSASGATLFIEPLATVDLNNRWHELQLAEAREVERILRELSRQVGEQAAAIERNVAALAELDLALAKARYSYELHAVPAEITTAGWPRQASGEALDPWEHPLYLIKARHPLLPRDSVVPIDVYIGGDYTVLLISGPNTGGKTVTLKTVGLLAAMHQAGLHIPAADGSRLPVFDGIYADIGDEQSIEQSLSTFSSHMTHIIDILRRADAGSLVLLDELGAGTDPVEGAALAQALMRAFLERRCLLLCSSHYSQLKVFAFSTPGVENASVEFDLETLSPTYRLTIGLPGRSNALAIAERLGLDHDLVQEARRYIAPDALQADEMLTRLKEAQESAEEARREIEATRERVRRMDRELREKLAQIEEARRMVLEEAREEGRQELARLRSALETLRRSLATQAAPKEAFDDAAAALEQWSHELAPITPQVEAIARPAAKLAVGDLVHVKTLDRTGELLRLDGQEAEVGIGGLRLRTPTSALEFRSRPKPSSKSGDSEVQAPQVASPGMELDLRGYRAEQVAAVLEKYLNDAYLAGLPWVRIIHGKGSGVLRNVVREIVQRHPLVVSHRLGELAEGGDGVTVVELPKLT